MECQFRLALDLQDTNRAVIISLGGIGSRDDETRYSRERRRWDDNYGFSRHRLSRYVLGTTCSYEEKQKQKTEIFDSRHGTMIILEGSS